VRRTSRHQENFIVAIDVGAFIAIKQKRCRMATESNKSHHSEKSDRTDPVGAEMDGLRDDLHQLKADVVHLFSRAFGLGKAGVGAVGDNASETMEHLKERLSDLRKRGADKVSENPLQSALIAFGIGFIMAKLLGRRR
jgi:ElaB/YqjD/DUF883 family membrane-anchored ribosome-binding protein